MIATSKIDLIDKYKVPKKVAVPMNLEERKEHKRSCSKCEEAHLFNIVNSPQFFCKVGDTITITSENAGAWKGVVCVRNAQGDTNFMQWTDLNVATNEREQREQSVSVKDG